MPKPKLFAWQDALIASEISSTELLVAFVLSSHMSTAGDSCFPSVATVVRESRTSRRTVQRSIARLRELGFLSVMSGNGRTNRYWARFPRDAP
jgi:hypothetical protein